MPASRSRTDRWRDCLAQIRDRRGGIEIAVDHGIGSQRFTHNAEIPAIPDLIWRVRLREVEHALIVVEQPGALGQRIRLPIGTPLIGAMSIGQNRWMFRTSVDAADGDTLRLGLPDTVERCTRRSRHRIPTAELTLPDVRCWVLRDPTTAARAEGANRAVFEAAARTGRVESSDQADVFDLDRPPTGVDVGNGFRARMANIGGGGLGLIVSPDQAGAVAGTRLYYTRLDLRPAMPAPLEMTVRMAHTHTDSSQMLHAGVAFEFGINPDHQGFVIEQIERYTDHLRETARAAAA